MRVDPTAPYLAALSHGETVMVREVDGTRQIAEWRTLRGSDDVQWPSPALGIGPGIDPMDADVRREVAEALRAAAERARRMPWDTPTSEMFDDVADALDPKAVDADDQ